MSTSDVACLAIIGPDNSPLAILKYVKESHDFEIDTLLFCTLDYFDQKLQKKGNSKPNESYLGIVQASDQYQIWGYKAALRYKIIVLTSHRANYQDNVMAPFCEKVKDVLFDSFMDPFYTPFSILDSPAFKSKIDSLIQNLQRPQ